MKKLSKKQIFIGVSIGIVLIIGIILGIFLFTKDKDNEVIKETITKTYTMYVSINPQVKLVFTETYQECTGDDGKKYICSGVEDNVTNYELINDDAKDFYNELDFKNKSYLEVLIMLCDSARENDVAFNKIEIITDYKSATREEIIEGIKTGSEYKVEFDVLIDVEERLNETEILEDLNKEKTYYTVKFNTDGGNELTNRVVLENDTLTDLEVPTKKGYTFVRWELNGKEFTKDTGVTKDITLKAIWKKNETVVNKEDNTNKNNNEQNDKENNVNNEVEETITKKISKSVTSSSFKKLNVYEDSSKRIGVEALYGCEKNINIEVTGPKSEVEKIKASNIELGVDFKDHKTSGTFEKTIIVTNEVTGITYKVLNPKINARLAEFKKLESTIDNINLNENILVEERHFYNSICGNTYVTTNFKEVFGNYLNDNRNSLYVYDCDGECESGAISRTEFDELSKNLIVDTAKLNRIVEKLQNIKSTTYKNVKDFNYDYDLNKGTFSYTYYTLGISDYYIDKLPNEMGKYIPDVLRGETGIYTTTGPCGTGPGEPMLLTEELCKQYNLTCSRW